LRRIIEVVLVLGNYMNRAYGVYSQAQGFSVESLVKLADTKATIKVKGRSAYTLLHHLQQYLEKAKPDLLQWPEEMRHLRDGHVELMNETIKQVSVLKEGLVTVKGELKQQKPVGNDPFQQIMTEFYNEAKEQNDKLDAEVDQTKKRFENLCTYFGEDHTKADPVSSIFKFAQVWAVAMTENLKAKEAKEKAAKKAVANAAMKKRIGVRQRKGTGASKTNTVIKEKKETMLNKKHMERRQKASTSRMSRRMQLLKRRKPGAPAGDVASATTATAKKAPVSLKNSKAKAKEKTKE